jgi:hypothetical protein
VAKTKVHPKVSAGATAGALSVVLVWTLAQAGVVLPPEVSSALTTLLSAAAGYMKKVVD